MVFSAMLTNITTVLEQITILSLTMCELLTKHLLAGG